GPGPDAADPRAPRGSPRGGRAAGQPSQPAAGLRFSTACADPTSIHGSLGANRVPVEYIRSAPAVPRRPPGPGPNAPPAPGILLARREPGSPVAPGWMSGTPLPPRGRRGHGTDPATSPPKRRT